MKKLFLYILILLSIIILQSCARMEDGEPGLTSDDTKSLIIGVWESENYVVSFGNDGFYSAYIADEFIDSGDYTQSKNIVSCQNSYFNRTTIYTIEEVSDDLLKVNIDYKDLYGNKKTKSEVIHMENESLFSNILSLLRRDLKKQSKLQRLIKRTNKELANLSECIQKAKSFEYPNDATAMFAEKVLEKYSRSIMQIDSASLSTEKSIWVYAHDYLDLSVYEERLKLSAGSLDDSKNAIQKDMKAFVDISLKSINLAMNTKYSFYLSSIELKNFDFDNGSLSARFELTINFR
mgnify:CR=1 FL=1